MKTILINPYPYYATGVEGVIYPPLGLLYLASAIKKNGLGEAMALDANILKMGTEAVVKEIGAYKPDVIGISSNIVTHKAALELMQAIREIGLKQLMLTGGPFPALFPEKYLAYCDIIVNGEGEETLCRILAAYREKKDLLSLKGILFKRGEAVINNNKERELRQDLDELPFPDYSLLKPSIGYYSKRSRVVKHVMAPLLTSRGCPYQCTYCNKSVFGSLFRYRSPDNIVAEIEWLNKNFDIDQIDILDDNFNLIPQRAEEVLDKILAKGLKVAISCHNGLRADKISEGFAKKLKASGVFKVGLGIETADRGVMGSIRKNLDLAKVERAVSLLRKQGITVHGYFILGLPGDTPATMARTIAFAKKANPHFCNFATCIPFPGTAVYDEVKRSGRFLVDVDDGVTSGFFGGKVFFEIGDTRARDVEQFYKKAYHDFYFNPRKALDIMLSLKSFKEFAWLAGTSCSLVVNALLGKGKRHAN